MNLNWKGRHLYVGRLYAGEVQRHVPEGWSEMPAYRDGVIDPAIAEGIKARRTFYEKRNATPYRCWVMLDDEGDHYGWFATEQQARHDLEARVKEMVTSTE